MNQLLEIITRKKPEKIYHLSVDISEENLVNLCQENDCKLFYIEGKNIKNKQEFFQACFSSLNLPDYFGNNWDAWEECLTDLSWCPANSYLFYYHNSPFFANNSPQDWGILLDILQEAIAYWQKQNTSFSVILSP